MNEEESIAGVLEQIPHEIVQQVIVVDNGSTDRTAEIAQAMGATVVREDFRGYGAACYAGTQAASDADILVFLDGDGADDPQEIPLLVNPILAGDADLVLGSRTRGRHETGALLPHARFGNWLAARLMKIFYGLKVSDLAPFRAIRRPALLALDMRERTYGWPTEMVVTEGVPVANPKFPAPCVARFWRATLFWGRRSNTPGHAEQVYSVKVLMVSRQRSSREKAWNEIKKCAKKEG